MANKLLTFLGTNDYLECNYYLNNSIEKIQTRFIQSALAKLICKNWLEDDKIIIFVTKDAKEINYDTPNKYNKPGLNEVLKDLKLKCMHTSVLIPEGKDVEELWKIFQKIIDVVDDKDNIYLDITHSFRFMPMLVLITLNYAKFLKGINISEVYYGAIESGGTLNELKKLDVKDRYAPIFNITQFVSLFDWTVAVEKFLSTGDATKISELTQTAIKPILRDTKGKDKSAAVMKKLACGLEKFSKDISICRGIEIQNSISEIKKTLNDPIILDSLLPQMVPMFQKIKDKYAYFGEDNFKNIIQVVKWCSEHNQIQQGFTFLQELIISFECKRKGYDITNRKNRENVACELSKRWKEVGYDKSKEEKGYNLTPENTDYELSKIYSEIGEYRNNINHAGYRENRLSYEKFVKNLKEYIQKVDNIINEKK